MVKQEQKCIFAKKIAIYMILYVITACNSHNCNIHNTNMFDIMCNTVGTIDINNVKNDSNIMGVLCKYLNEHPHYNTFVIMELPIAKLKGDRRTGVFMGPGYKSLYEDIYYGKVLDTINIKGIKTYIISDRCQNNIKKDDWKNKNPTDSIIIGNNSNRISYYAYDNFLWRALYIYRQNGKYGTIDRLDTVMFVKEVPSSIQFTSPGNQ